MANKMAKDPQQIAGGMGCTVGCLTFVALSYIFSKHIDKSGGIIAFLVSIVAGLIAYFVTKKIKTEESEREKQEVIQFVTSAEPQSTTLNQNVDQSIQLMCRATYLGGHKKYTEKADVSVVLTSDRILLKELPGHPETRIDIPYAAVTDFGLATKEQLTVTRMLLVGILAFALKKKAQYLYVKYKDQLGFENNPVLGEFVGANISNINSQLYALIENARGT